MTAPRALWAGAALVVIGTLLLYQPWRLIPFDITDFSEFLPLLRRASIGARWSGFLQYYASQGRWNVLAYAAIIAKWSVFGMNTAGWALSRFAEMWLIIALVYVVLRRFGADAWGAAAGAALLTVATPAVQAWLRLTMGEPLGLAFLMLALLAATRYRGSLHWRRDAVLIAVLVALALLSKEMLVVFVPFVLVIAACLAAPGRLESPHLDRRTVCLVACVAIATIAVLAPVAAVALHAPPGNYASQYGGWKMDPEQLALNFATVLLPVTQSRPDDIASLFTTPANALFQLTLAVGGWLIYSRRATHRFALGRVAVWAGLALSLPVCVVIAYGPWSYFQDFYGLPYVLGPAMLLAGAVTAAAGRRLAPALRIACTGILLLGAVRALPAAQKSIARRTVQGDLAGYLAATAGHRPVLVMKADFQPSLWARWQDTGPTLGRYAAAMYPLAGLEPFHDTTCVVPPPLYAVGGRAGVVVTYAADCGIYRRPTMTFRALYRYVTLHPPAIWRDTIRIDVCDSSCAERRP
jgi:hypothetical protein